MSKLVDLTGRRFGKLLVVARADNIGKNSAWQCRCDCGKSTIVSAPNLKSGSTSSCGCGLRESTIRRNTKHNGSYTKLYKVWGGMKARCYNHNNKQYDDYGGRGILICEEWKNNYKTFQEWALANGYKEGLTIDRKDNDKGYSPDNCRWVTYEIQNQNRRPKKCAKKNK